MSVFAEYFMNNTLFTNMNSEYIIWHIRSSVKLISSNVHNYTIHRLYPDMMPVEIISMNTIYMYSLYPIF